MSSDDQQYTQQVLRHAMRDQKQRKLTKLYFSRTSQLQQLLQQSDQNIRKTYNSPVPNSQAQYSQNLNDSVSNSNNNSATRVPGLSKTPKTGSKMPPQNSSNVISHGSSNIRNTQLVGYPNLQIGSVQSTPSQKQLNSNRPSSAKRNLGIITMNMSTPKNI